MGKYDSSPQMHTQPKPYSPQSMMQTDWSKHPTQNQQRPGTIPAQFSRSPYATNNEQAYQQQSSAMKGNYKPPDAQQQAMYPNYNIQQQQQQQQPRYDQQTSTWNPNNKPQMSHSGGNVGMPPQNSQQQQMSILGKPPTRPIPQAAPMMNSQRFQMPAYQMNSNSLNQSYNPNKQQMPNRVQQPMGVNPYVTNDNKSRQSPVISSQFGSNQNKNQKQQQHLNAAGSGGMKAPPVPTLVRGCGSSLVGKKAIHMSEDTVRSNQASDRASLLQSIAGLISQEKKVPDPAVELAKGSTDWSTKVANSSPLPQRKPGMRHPGVENFRKDSLNRRGNDAGGNRNSSGKRPGRHARNKNNAAVSPCELEQLNNNGGGAQPPAAAVVAAADASAAESKLTAKKLTLADTQPKKGEVSMINIREGASAAAGSVASAAAVTNASG